jgi:protein-L-isoaspartate(D-aspartate) O-methyltransferase
MIGWRIPPPKKPEKSMEEFRKERERKVKQLIRHGLLKSQPIIQAMLKVPREDFILEIYRDYAYYGSDVYEEVPLPIPGEEATISCPHSYPLFYEALELRRGEVFLEVGAGSGYGAAIAREIVGNEGKVVTIEIDEKTYEFAKRNIEKSGYTDILLILGDGSLGYIKEAPYDKICITAACKKIPDPLISQLKEGGKLLAPVGGSFSQDLVLLEKKGKISYKVIDKVLYVPLRGRYGMDTL